MIILMLFDAKNVGKRMGLSLLQKPSNRAKEERSLILSLGFYLEGALVAPQHCHILRLSRIQFKQKIIGFKQRNLTF